MKYFSLAIIAALSVLIYMTVLDPYWSTTDKDSTSNIISTGAKTMSVKLTTNHGDITIELYPDKAPETVENFLQYVNDGFFNGTIFHRVIPGFMIQGGGFIPGMEQKETRATIKNEADNGLKNEIGTLAMARTPDPHSASSQFFINVKNNSFLDFSSPTPQGWGYCVFGKVIDGMDIVHEIEKVSTTSSGGHQDVPANDVIIENASVVPDETEEGDSAAAE